MPYVDNFKTLRVAAGIRISKLAKEADLSRDTIRRIEKHKNCSEETLVTVVNTLNRLHYGSNGSALDYNKLITKNSRFGGNP